MSELIRCASCGKVTNLSDAADWWHIEPARVFIGREDDGIMSTLTYRPGMDGPEGSDYCSDECVSKFFIERIHDSICR